MRSKMHSILPGDQRATKRLNFITIPLLCVRVCATRRFLVDWFINSKGLEMVQPDAMGHVSEFKRRGSRIFGDLKHNNVI